MGLKIDIFDGTALARELSSNQTFTVDAKLEVTVPDGDTQEIPYSSSSHAQTVSFSNLGLEIDSSNAEQTATELLNSSQGFTVDARLGATAPDGTHQEIPC